MVNLPLPFAYILLLVALALFVYGLWHTAEGWAQRADAARRVRLARGEPAGQRIRAATDVLLRRTRHGRALETRLVVAGIEIRPSEALAVVVAAAAAGFLAGALFLGPVLAVAAAAGAVFACERYLGYRQMQRREEFVAQLPEVAWIMSNASAAGLALPRMIELAAGELGDPSSDVLQRVVEELRVGQPVDKALDNLQARMPSREVSVLVSTLTIQQRTGGDTVTALREMASTLDARKDLRREVRTTVAGAVSTSWAVGGLAAGALVVLNMTSPGVLREMTHTGLGRIALVVGLSLFAGGFWLTRRVTRIET